MGWCGVSVVVVRTHVSFHDALAVTNLWEICSRRKEICRQWDAQVHFSAHGHGIPSSGWGNLQTVGAERTLSSPRREICSQ